VTPVLAEVPTDVDAIREAATQIATAHVGPGQSFCFRLHRRGWRLPAPEAAALEHAIGGSIFDALERSRGAPPTVDLEQPDLTVVAEVLGPRTLMGVAPRPAPQEE
jgi:tRNA(Ser,Leu) C12 N-acetylase TAN1